MDMPVRGITFPVWLLLLLLLISGMDSLPFNLFRKNTEVLPQEGKLRLVGSKSVSEGRVEIYHDGKWGTVCDDGWDLAEAQVVCRQLQFAGAKAAVNHWGYGAGSLPIWLDDIECEGTESTLSSCPFKGWALTDCTHMEDAGVVCEIGTNTSTSDTRHLLDHSVGLSEELGQLFDSGDGCDFLILVQSPAGSRQEDGRLETVGTTVCAHKAILAHFPRFNASEETTTNLSVQVSQACQPHFTAFIRYIYTRKMEVTVSSAQCLHWLSSEFGAKQLMQDTGRLFTQLLPEDSTFRTQVSLYGYSVETGDLLLRENCLQYLAWNFEDLSGSPAWSHLSADLLRALLSRSDLVAPDEAFLLRSLESWISETEGGDLAGVESQADLLSGIRFPMIPAEKLYDLQFTSQLYGTHRNLYRDNMLKGFQFSALPLGTLKSQSSFNGDDRDYQPRIYTAEPWSVAFDSVMVERGTPAQPSQLTRQMEGIYDLSDYFDYEYATPSSLDDGDDFSEYTTASSLDDGDDFSEYATPSSLDDGDVFSEYTTPSSLDDGDDFSEYTTASSFDDRVDFPEYDYEVDYSWYSSVSTFSTPVHNSVIFKNNMINWQANVFISQSECSANGYECESFPVARLSSQISLSQSQSGIRFSNRLLVMCQGRHQYICQVQEFKSDLAHISVNGSQELPYPCPDGQYSIRFVVRPEYI